MPAAELTGPDDDGPRPDRRRGVDADVLDVLRSGEVEILGRMPWSSNATFLVEACLDGRTARGHLQAPRRRAPAVGLPRRPLPPGGRGLRAQRRARLGRRAPHARPRRRAPTAIGSLQRFVDADFEQHYFTLLEDEAHPPPARAGCAVFDLVSNNTDRKGGHCLLDARRPHLGHRQRPVVPRRVQAAHRDLGLRRRAHRRRAARRPRRPPRRRACPSRWPRLLDTFERDALLTRARALLRERALPIDDTGHRYPWPLV